MWAGAAAGRRAFRLGAAGTGRAPPSAGAGGAGRALPPVVARGWERLGQAPARAASGGAGDRCAAARPQAQAHDWRWRSIVFFTFLLMKLF